MGKKEREIIKQFETMKSEIMGMRNNSLYI